MRRSFYRGKPKPAVVELSDSRLLGLEAVREQLLNNALFGSLVLGAITVAVAIPARIQEGKFALAILYGLVYLWIIVVTINHRLTQRLRTMSFLGIVFVLGTVLLFSDGIAGNGRIFLLSLPILTTILLGGRAGIFGIFLSWGVLALFAYLNVNGFALGQSGDYLSPASTPLTWGLAFTVFMLVSGVLSAALASMFRGMQSLLEHEQELSSDLAAERSQLDRRVQLRTQELERKLTQNKTAIQIANQISSILSPQDLLQEVVDQIAQGFDLYFVGIFLVKDQGDKAILQAGTGEAGKQLLAEGYMVPIDNNSMIGGAILHHQPRVALDVGGEARRFNNPILQSTRSEMVIPLLTSRVSEPGNQMEYKVGASSCLGAITVQSVRPMEFDDDDIVIFQAIANSIATALENARLFQQLHKAFDEISTLNRQYLRQSWSRVAHERGLLTYVSEDAGVEVPKNIPGYNPAESYTVPLVLRDQVIGLLSIEKEAEEGELSTITPEDKALIDAVITQAALALENVRLLEETQRRAANERLLSEISRKARSTTDIDAILRMAVKEISQGLGASEGQIMLEVPAANENDL